MNNIRVFLSENFQILEVKLSIYLNRRVFVMYGKRQKSLDFSSCTCTVTQIFRPTFTAAGEIHIGSCPVPLFDFAPSQERVR